MYERIPITAPSNYQRDYSDEFMGLLLFLTLTDIFHIIRHGAALSVRM